MKCFNHHEIDAVAVCRHCGKALCPECVVETEHGISCQGRCERHVGEMNELLNRAEKDAQGYRSLGMILIAFAVLLAILAMALPGFLEKWFGEDQPPLGWFLIAFYGLTAISFAAGLFCYRQGMTRY